ncbi:phage repressor protein [Halopenitus persicus]|uniref:phage repressor protein n=1 Tax=Halopenitus persicus TaxID=1048396 RepID=UPI000BBB16A3|nr:phage repressor protein [Halopenitus persicus]
MRLTVPTDFEILSALSDGRRNNAANLAYVLDRNRSYINTRLPVLTDYGLLERVGPAPNSGLYVITDWGQIAARNQAAYEDDDLDFEALIERELSERDGDDES